ncbi:MAG: ABC transporter permease [Clostridia bacterium]|nr:ABC transporter permease [Clostridia bacterium]
MKKYILKKLLTALPVLIGITVIDFLLMNLAGSPLSMMSGPRVTEAAKALKAEQLGLDQPLVIQYFQWLGQLLQGNLGYSYKSYQPVAEIIGSHLGPTLLLTSTALIVGLLIAVPAGIYSAVHRYQRRDYAVVTASFLGSSIPGFFLSLLLIYVFTVRLKWLPSFGMSTAGTGGDAWDVLQHLAMPALVLALSIAGNNIRYIRSAMLEILSMDYLRTARSKGIGRRLVINKHALRNALLPIITVIGMEIPVLFGGSIIIEQIFSWPGLGLITMNAITGRDYPVIMGVSLLSAVVVLAANLITDILYALADPTIKY